MQFAFISYSTKDGSDFANLLRHELSNKNIKTWMSEDIGISDNWNLEIDQKLEECCALILVMTNGAKTSENVIYEWSYALGLKKKVVTILRESVELHYKLKDLQRTDFRSSANKDRPWSELFDALQKIFEDCDNRSRQNLPDVETTTQGRDFSDLIEKLRHGDQDTQFDVASALGEARAIEAVPALIDILNELDEYTRKYAAKTLGEIGDTRATEKLVQTLINDPSFIVRAEAADALGELKDKNSVPALRAALNDHTVSVRSASVRALGKIGDPSALPEIRKALFDPGKTTRAYASRALGIMRDKESTQNIITSALNHEDSYVRGHAADALGKIGDPSAVEGLLEHLEDNELWFTGKRVSDAVADALYRIGTPEALAAVEEWRRQQNQH